MPAAKRLAETQLTTVPHMIGGRRPILKLTQDKMRQHITVHMREGISAKRSNNKEKNLLHRDSGGPDPGCREGAVEG